MEVIHGAYNGDSEKKLILMGTATWTGQLVCKATPEDQARWVPLCVTDSKRSCGTPPFEGSEHYSVEFGCAVAEALTRST